MSEGKKTGETEVTQAGAVEVNDEQLDAASGGATDILLNTSGLKGEGKILGATSVKFGDGSVRGVKFNPIGKP